MEPLYVEQGAFEEIQGKRFPVLDHGHVTLIDAMGSDQDIVAAARTSYQKGTKSVSSDETLIRYLYRMGHTSPFESAYLKFHLKLPIFVMRQLVRHRTFGLNEVSARYSELPEEYYVPDPEDIQYQSTTNKQGGEESVPDDVGLSVEYRIKGPSQEAFTAYHSMLEDNVSRELARVVLPVGTYTECVWYGNLHNLLHFLRLRMDQHAQKQIKVYADIIGYEIVARLFPMTWQAFIDYRLESMSLTRLDQEVIKLLGTGVDFEVALAKMFSNKRERQECLTKLTKLRIIGSDI